MRFIKRNWIIFLSLLGLLILIFDSQVAVAGALEGIRLCAYTLIPAMLPFLILSSMLVGALQGRTFRFLKGLCRFCGIPAGAESLFLIGLIGGYPVGAKLVADAYKNRSITKNDAAHMLGFCSNAGPAFIFGVVGPQFSSGFTVWLIWIIHIFSAILTAFLLKNPIPGVYSPGKISKIIPSDIIENSTKVMAVISTWVILFRIILLWLKKWVFFLLPLEIQVLISGVFELANGCTGLSLIDNSAQRLVICSAILSLGGLCVLMQTYAVTNLPGIGKYLPGKLIQTALSIIISIGFVCSPPVTVATIAGYMIILRIIQRKTVDFLPNMHYNQEKMTEG